MAGCRVREDREIIQILRDVSSVREVENRYQCIKIKDIQQEIDFPACFVKGKPIKATLLWWNLRRKTKSTEQSALKLNSVEINSHLFE